MVKFCYLIENLSYKKELNFYIFTLNFFIGIIKKIIQMNLLNKITLFFQNIFKFMQVFNFKLK